MGISCASSASKCRGLLRRLLRDRAGNTLAILAAAILPLLAMVGGGVDMGRSYLSQSRLQQACDAGVLAARKRLGSDAATTGEIGSDVGEIGQRFFNVNFRDGSYGTKNRDFTMTLEDDYAISGIATVDVPTTIMGIFGFNNVPIKVKCEAQINLPNTDVMMVLDVTGSMATTNPGDSQSRIATMKDTIKTFHAQLAAASQAGSKIRYGFVPYSTNVNVGGLLLDDWVTNTWTYQSRDMITDVTNIVTKTYYTASSPVSGSYYTSDYESYSATYDEPSASYVCTSKPANSLTSSTTSTSKSVVVATPLPGTKKTTTYVRTRNGKTYYTELHDTTCVVKEQTYDNYVDTYDKVEEPALAGTSKWRYKPIEYDVSDWRTSGNGCIEERDTYEIDDYNAVDLTRALDLDIDRVPTPGDPATQWRPMMPDYEFFRALKWDGTGQFETKQEVTNDEYVTPVGLKTAACPAPAMKLTELTDDELQAYLDTLQASGSTYHDIGMIWGARLISPNGIFSSENQDATSRHLIFLTDGETAPLDLSYSSYGLEPIDQRRWSPSSSYTLTQTVEKRFSYVCQETRKENITVWIIGFGTTLSDLMKDCAGEGHYFEAADAAELNASFATIAKSISDLRVSK